MFADKGSVIRMKLAFIDCRIAGVSGDMLTAALIDAGASVQRVKKAMLRAAKPFGKVGVEVGRVRVSGIKATRVNVNTRDRGGRSYEEIIREVKRLPLPAPIVNKSLEALGRLAKAEAKVHGETTETLHLHEIGAADAIADIVGCCTAAHEFGLFEREVLASEIAVGQGTIKSAHGEMPLPAPATLELLRGRPIRGKAIDAELTTPTGAALLTTLATRFVRAYPAMRVDAIGYGAGARRLRIPNLVRVCLSEAPKHRLELEEIALLETNVDDVSGEVMGHAIEKLIEEGALDATVTPLLMKKGRPGFLIQVIAKPKDAERLACLLMLHTGTLGVRVLPITHRYALEREVVPVEVKLVGRKFKARVKVARENGKLVGIKAEYEDAQTIANKTGFALRDIMRYIEEIAKNKIK